MKITVTNCHDCPFQNNDQEDGFSCRHPQSDVEDYQMTPYEKENEPHIPDECPLRSGDTLVTIKQ